MIQSKSELRKKLIRLRLSLHNSQVQEYSYKIIEKLIDYINWQEINNINIYQTIEKHNEINISDLLEFIEQNYPSVQIDTTENKVSENNNIPKGKNYDLVIVPLLGFDRSGNRLGYGGGYYDKFLAKNNCKQIIGLGYSLQEVQNLPVEPHDQKLDAIITEKEIIKP